MLTFPKQKHHKGVLFFRNIPPAVKSLFKSAAYRRGDSMTDVIHALMLLYTKNPEVIEKELRRIKRDRR